MRGLYNPKTLGKDAVAGLTLGIESIPDAMASGLLAGVNPIYALYAVMLATPVGALFASSAFMSVQTTSAMSLIVADASAVHRGQDPGPTLFMLTILTGVIMLGFGVFKLGFILRYVSNAVMTGFISGIAVMIILGQLRGLTGYSSPESNKVAAAFDTLLHLRRIDSSTLAVGLLTILLIVVLQKTALKSFGIVAALALGSAAVQLMSWDSVALVREISAIPDALPLPTLPAFAAIPALILPAASLAFVGLVQGAGVSQNYVNPDGKYPDASGDFVGQGMANVFAGFFQGMPVGGSLSATALVKSAGAKSRMANILAGATIVFALLALGELIGALAMPTLAALLMVVGFQTLKPAQIATVWKTGRVQQVVMVATFASTLIMPLQYAVILGVALSTLLFVVRQSNQTTVKQWVLDSDHLLPIEKDPPVEVGPRTVTILRPYGSLFYAAAQILAAQLPKVTDETDRSAVILTLRGRMELGSTVMDVLERYAAELRQHGSRLMLADLSSAVRNELEAVGFAESLGKENLYLRTERVAESTLQAFEHATAWVEQA